MLLYWATCNRKESAVQKRDTDQAASQAMVFVTSRSACGHIFTAGRITECDCVNACYLNPQVVNGVVFK